MRHSVPQTGVPVAQSSGLARPVHAAEAVILLKLAALSRPDGLGRVYLHFGSLPRSHVVAADMMAAVRPVLSHR